MSFCGVRLERINDVWTALTSGLSVASEDSNLDVLLAGVRAVARCAVRLHPRFVARRRDRGRRQRRLHAGRGRRDDGPSGHREAHDRHDDRCAAARPPRRRRLRDERRGLRRNRWGEAAKTGVLARSILMKIGSGRALARLQGWAEGLPCLISLRALRLRRISRLAGTGRLVGYCSSIFLVRTRAGVRAENAEHRAET